MSNLKTIALDGVDYVRADQAKPLDVVDDFCIVRTYSAGVFAGNLVARRGKEGVIENAIRIYYWSGAATLSQLAMEGVTKPHDCKFAMPVTSIDLTEIIEVIPCTASAMRNILAVKSWKK